VSTKLLNYLLSFEEKVGRKSPTISGNQIVSKKRRLRFLSPMRCSLVLFAAFLSGSALAHHSVSQFDSSKELVLEGTISVMEWANPHVWIRILVLDDDGNEVEWGVEASNPLNLSRKGWSKKTFKTGDKAIITIHPARNEKPFGRFVRATLSEGESLGRGY
jgi:hypothetical protein